MRLMVAGLQVYNFRDEKSGREISGRKLHFLVEGEKDYQGFATKAKGIKEGLILPTFDVFPCMCDCDFDFQGRVIGIVPVKSSTPGKAA